MSIDHSYDQWAESYDTDINKTRDLDREITQRVLRKIDFKVVLELGCGTGKNTEWLINKTGSIKALDFSRKMLDQAEAKIHSEKVQFIHTDLKSSWPLPDQAFDLITCNLVLEHIDNLNIIFRQAFDKLQKTGYFFVSELHPNRQYRGRQAQFETPTGQTHLIKVFTHHISDYLKAATQSGLTLIQLDEWFDEDNPNKVPRLVSFLFQKP